MCFCCMLSYIPSDMLRSGRAWAYGSSRFVFLRNLHTDFHGDYTNLHSYQQCIKGSLFSHIIASICFCFLDDSHSDWDEVEYQCPFFFVVRGLELRAYTLSHSTSPFCVRYFWDRCSWPVCPSWLQAMILLISASWVVRITGVNH
jgi:hypothetical protein